MSATTTAARDALRRVRDGLDHLRDGILPFVTARMAKARGPDWTRYASRAAGHHGDGLDAYALLKTMLDNWRDGFEEAFPTREKQRARNFASMSLEARNAVAHLTLPLAADEALRYLDAMHGLLRATKAPEAEVAALKRLWEEQGRAGFAAPSAPTGAASGAPPAAAPSAPPSTLARPAAPEAPSRTLRPWHEVALPHPDVIANRFKEAEFAADLFAVDAGHASEAYATPTAFFGITFLTEGLRRVLASALARLADMGGDPVIGLQTAFGGGKTHTMLGILHLARHMADGGVPGTLPGLEGIAEQSGIKIGHGRRWRCSSAPQAGRTCR